MLPVIIYDFSNGFKQTVVFFGWTLYKPFSFLFKHSPGNFLSNLQTIITFGLANLQKLIFQGSIAVSLLLFILTLIILSYLVFKDKLQIKSSVFLLFFFLIVSLAGIVVNQTPSDAYLPITMPFLIFSTAILFDFSLKIRFIKYLTFFLLVVILITNAYTCFKNDSATNFKNRINAVNKIIKISNGQKYNLVGKGPGSQFISYTMNYEYLLWWKGYPPSHKNESLKIIISEDLAGIHVNRK
jgi:hypothetical protein